MTGEKLLLQLNSNILKREVVPKNRSGVSPNHSSEVCIVPGSVQTTIQEVQKIGLSKIFPRYIIVLSGIDNLN